ncbi:GNAT family N-acetyltransferase [Paenibacillus sp. CF384]|uniref:GNAT family N-acetyltransferase n=1 Tax=Paenibacillus sp. CF384 TaxID=1884382 RepID=UPI00115FB6A7|nr:GNAT family N-acetyltransferase [Paenibacillus sp. CF384]
MKRHNLTIQLCTTDDVELLAVLNKQLIEDEKHDNTMDIEQLKARMKHFIETDYRAYKFVVSDEVRGYALVNHSRSPLYLRHFFICRKDRRNGYGKLAFVKLTECLNTKEMDLEVMHWNEAAHHFWKSLGFKERSVYMRLESLDK